MYDLIFSPTFARTAKKLKKKNRQLYEIIKKKAAELVVDPNRYKNLNYPYNNLKRVHIDTHFILLFSVDEEAKTVTLEEFVHHDDAYK
jgi:YafQ family addiction module toxin component